MSWGINEVKLNMQSILKIYEKIWIKKKISSNLYTMISLSKPNIGLKISNLTLPA